MPGIYSIFEGAAKVTGKIPWRWRLMAGSAAGAAGQGFFGDKDRDLMDRITEGIVMGAGTGLLAGPLLRVAGRGAQLGAAAGKKITGNRFGAFQKSIAKRGLWDTVQRSPFVFAAAGAGVGYMVAPEGQKAKGVMMGAGFGLMVPTGIGVYKGYNALGKVPGAQNTAFIAAAAVPLAAQVAFGHGKPEASAYAVPGVGGTIDYEPLSEGMADRMTAMNASGDIVLGLNGRRHG